MNREFLFVFKFFIDYLRFLFVFLFIFIYRFIDIRGIYDFQLIVGWVYIFYQMDKVYVNIVSIYRDIYIDQFKDLII